LPDTEWRMESCTSRRSDLSTSAASSSCSAA
jgi:hypothetical protein